jgi:hypothetical protein
VLDGDVLVGIVSAPDLLDALARSAGASEPSSRLEVEVPNRPGSLAALLRSLAGRGLNVSSVSTTRSEPDVVCFAIRVDSIDGPGVATGLVREGWSVLWPDVDTPARAARRPQRDPGGAMTHAHAMLVDDPILARSPFGEQHPFRAERGAITRTLLEATGALRPTTSHRSSGSTSGSWRRARRRLPRGRGAGGPRRTRRRPAQLRARHRDCPIVEGMHRVALRVADASVSAAELVASGTALRALHLTGGMHHAHRARASGFCLVNDLALAIEHLTRRHGWRVAYLDLDAHHGDGVQAAFWERGDVLTFSMHQSGRTLFPGTGGEDEIGAGDGRGTSVNLPLDPFTDDAGAWRRSTHSSPTWSRRSART